MKILLMSDIHGNQQAIMSVMKDISEFSGINAYILLGDIVDYGMHSNEVIGLIKKFPSPFLCNIRGNHEDAIINEHYEHFSSARGRDSAKYIRDSLNAASWDYITNSIGKSGKAEFMIGDKKCLAVHGSLEDEYWKSISPDVDAASYAQYDYVFSGHSHLPHYFEKYVKVDNPFMRNKKKVIFINPGSVGQPRNHNNKAQYVILDTHTEEIVFCKAKYNIAKEQSAYHGEIDEFYKERLELGV